LAFGLAFLLPKSNFGLARSFPGLASIFLVAPYILSIFSGEGDDESHETADLSGEVCGIRSLEGALLGGTSSVSYSVSRS
jgi:hypothetical protein